MEKFNGNEAFIHSYEENLYHHRRGMELIKDPEGFRDFMQRFYCLVISTQHWPEHSISALGAGFTQILFVLDAAWLSYQEKHAECGKHRSSLSSSLDITSMIDISDADLESSVYSPHLSLSKWPAARFSRFQGRVSLLSREEVADELGFYKAFFEFCSLNAWKQKLNQWMEAALCQQAIFSLSTQSPWEIYQDYLLLLKCMERVWLDEQQDDKLRYHELMPWYDVNNYPVFGTLSFNLNPYQAIYDFWLQYPLQQAVSAFESWMNAVLKSGHPYAERPVNLLFLLKDYCILADSLWLIGALGKHCPKKWNHYQMGQQGGLEPRIGGNYTYKLSSQLQAHPQNYLPLFFQEYHLELVLHFLYESCIAALGEPDAMIFSEDEVEQFKQAFVLLLEAGFLIQQQHSLLSEGSAS